LPLFSTCIQTKTKAPVNGMTTIRPAIDGNFFQIPVARRIMTKLKIIFIKICMNIFCCPTTNSAAAVCVCWNGLLGSLLLCSAIVSVRHCIVCR
jgi:hypothetical protein